MTVFILWAVIIVFIALLIKAVVLLFKKRYKEFLLTLITPWTLLMFLLVYFIVGVCQSIERSEDGIPESTAYNNSYDLTKATGVEFPEVTPVDSLWHDDWCNHYTRVKFVPTKPLDKSFFRKLDRACTEDSCCWVKCDKDSCYRYYIYPEHPLDRTKGTHNRKVEWKNENGTITFMDKWDGDYVSVIVPFKGDTITIEDGWIR